MPVIVTCSTKGGVGKSTTALILAQVYAQAGAGVTMLDADPNQPIAKWALRTGDQKPSCLKVIPDVNELNILDLIDNASATDPYIIVDLEGSANMTASYAISRADLVLIPMRGKQLDADEAAKVVSMIERNGRAWRREIPYRIMFSMISALRSKELRHIEASFKENNIPMLDTAVAERAAFSAIFQLGGTIYDLSKEDVSKPDAAIENAEAVAKSVFDIIQQTQQAAA